MQIKKELGGINDGFRLISIHNYLRKAVNRSGGTVDKIYNCTDILDASEDRKPNIGMAAKAKMHFPEIDFRKSIMIVDSESEMRFGKKLSMYTIYINKLEFEKELFKLIDCKCDSLFHSAKHLTISYL